MMASPITPSAGSGGYKATLDQMPIEKLQAMIIKNQEEKISLMDQKEALARGEDTGEDPEMIDMKYALLTKRINELKAALSARGNLTSARQTPPPVSSSASTLASDTVPRLAYPTPDTVAGPSRPRLQAQPSNERVGLRMSSDDTPRQAFKALPFAATPNPAPVTSRPKMQPTPVKPIQPPTPPPDIDDADIAMPEQYEDNGERIPPSSPPQPPIVTPSRSTRNSGAMARRAALAEMENIPPDAFLTSPTPPALPKPARSQPSTARSIRANAVAGPSKPSPTVAKPRPIYIETRHPWSKEVEDKLKTYFKIPKFRYHQKEAIDETMAGKDVFVLMPTGGGKSLTYQLPAICQGGKTRGITFVVSPLISLINDQTRHLCKLGIPAIAYTGEMTQKDKNAAHEQMDIPEPWTRVVYVTPEMMSMGGQIKGIMRRLVDRKRLARFVIDEAHCVSQWGHDFREDYLKLENLRKEYPSVPIMALTATAQDKVQDDIIRQLGIQGCAVLKQSFNRPNLHYEIRPKKKNILGDMVGFINTQPAGSSGIIYCSSRDKCEVVAKELREKYGLGARHYHAGMTKGDRRSAQEDWQDHKFEIIVATIAFGMGIDKPDVRYVLHHTIPRSLEGYYQETGRAGRDGLQSTCVLYYTFGDYQGTVRLIAKDQATSYETKERQKAAVDEVLRFCSNKTDCRRTQILSFFNEKFDAADCHRSCDICLSRENNIYQDEDVTADAKTILLLMGSFDRKAKITLTNLVDCFRGYGGNSAKNLGANPYFGAGKDWAKPEADRFVQLLMYEGALEEYYVANHAGWNNSYLKLGKASQAILSGKKTLKMSFNVAVAATKLIKNAKTRTAKSGQQGIESFTKRISNPISRKRSEQQIRQEEEEFDKSGWGDEDDDYIPNDEIDDADSASGGGEQDDPIECVETDVDDEDTPVTRSKKRKTRADPVNATTKAKSAKKTREVPWEVDDAGGTAADDDDDDAEIIEIGAVRKDNQSPVDQCLNELRAVVNNMRAKNAKLPAVTDSDLQMLAVMMPLNAPAMAQIDGLRHDIIKAYGSRWLPITMKYKKFTNHADTGPSIVQTSAKSGVHVKAKETQVQLNLNSYAYTSASTSKSTVPSVPSRPTSGASVLRRNGSTVRPSF